MSNPEKDDNISDIMVLASFFYTPKIEPPRILLNLCIYINRDISYF